METQDNYITILTGTHPNELIVAQSILESEGIACFIKDEFITQIIPFYSNAIGGVKLQVKQEDLDRSLALLNARPDDDPAIEENNLSSPAPGIQGTACPNCGSDNVSKPGRSPKLFAISLLLFSIPLPFGFISKTKHCFDCGADFTNGK